MATESKQSKSDRRLYFLIYVLIILLVAVFAVLVVQIRKNQAMRRDVPKTAEQLTPGTSKLQQQSAAVRGLLGDDFAEFDPFTEMERMRSRMNHMLNTFRRHVPTIMHELQQGQTLDYVPAIDIEETETSYIVRCDLPGLEKDKIDVSVSGNLLTIQGMRSRNTTSQDDQTGYYSSERSYGSFSRSITLPGPVNESAISAEYVDGVLVIELPKSDAAQDIHHVVIQ